MATRSGGRCVTPSAMLRLSGSLTRLQLNCGEHVFNYSIARPPRRGAVTSNRPSGRQGGWSTSPDQDDSKAAKATLVQVNAVTRYGCRHAEGPSGVGCHFE